MNDLGMTLLVLLGGSILGILFFGGLWFTVKKALVSNRPALWFLGSLIVRVGLTLLGFYYMGRGDWKNMVFCLLGFIIARFAVLRITKTMEAKELQLKNQN
ncbi:F1/F0 ATPase, subunit 2 [Pricia antarctica]|uniref:F1/F0 ATPase, subunit 2 n=1 Tax=Pricia antarctica TaxID=641691 RepID=A0A1G7D0Q1_9FLAO|nr:ATP synthase subunit I [Pricia antarctica]SDE45099.1 F1/F0 ATPase, subunit 2 [Pricia antarctica]